MNRRTLWIALLSIVALGVVGCGGGGHLTVTITTAPTTLAAGASSNVVATVTHDPAAGGVTWSCTPGNSAATCGSFNPTSTPSGTGTTYTAPPAPPSGGAPVVITATSVTNTARSASANVTITGVATANFVFYASGEENNVVAGFFDQYSIAGVVAIAQDGTGDVIAGEQDYNDGDGNTSPQPTGDTITGGQLVMASDGSGNAILTLTTSNANLPNAGTEVFALAFANTSHAVIVEFDGTATSSGSYDLQTSTAALVSASYSFVASGADTSFDPICDGGVFAVDANGNITGTYDVNDNGAPSLDNTIPAGVSAGPTDSFGRGAVVGSIVGDAAINYYVVGPEVTRIINVDPGDTAVGSAYGQGSTAGNFSSLGPSVFSIGNALIGYGAVGQFTTDGSSFSGEADLNDLAHGIQLGASEIDGSYTLAANGYGLLTFGDSDFGDDVTNLGVYAVDPTLNILDPNNSTADTADSGGALLAEMDTNLVGIGSIVPQTDVTMASFTGFYAFGAQGDANGADFNFVGTATVTPGDTTSSFVGEGSLSDPFGALTDGGVDSPNATFNATAAAPDSAGRYSLGPIAVAASNGTDFGAFSFATVTAYQASGGQLYWLEVDDASYFLGPLEQGAAPSGDARKAHAKASIKKH